MSDTQDQVVGRVLRAQSGFYAVATDAGDVTAVLRGRVKKDRRESGLIALGDMVRLAPLVPTTTPAGVIV